METGTADSTQDSRNEKPHSERSFTVRVPASTANLGAGFDCFGLALKLYLKVRASVVPETSLLRSVLTSGESVEGAALPRTEDNLILLAMRFAAERESLSLPPGGARRAERVAARTRTG